MFENLRAKTYTWKLEVVFILTIHTHTHTHSLVLSWKHNSIKAAAWDF